MLFSFGYLGLPLFSLFFVRSPCSLSKLAGTVAEPLKRDSLCVCTAPRLADGSIRTEDDGRSGQRRLNSGRRKKSR